MPSTITGVSSMATRQILAGLGETYEQRTGIPVAIQSMGGVDAAKRVRTGEPLDVVVLAADALRKLEAEGHIVAGSRVDLARSGIAMAVRAGAPKPPIDNAEVVKRAILDAEKVGFSTGPSGDYLKALWAKWGIADFVAQHAVQAPAGVPVATLLARGDVDLGFQQLSELLHEPGIEIVGPLPPDIQSLTLFSAAVCMTSSNAEAARAYIAYLASPDADALKRRYGMEPA